MASFLGAASPNGAPVLLASNVAVSVATTAAQAVFTATQRCVPLYMAVRNTGATALASAGTYSCGVTGSLGSFVTTAAATSIGATTGFVIFTCQTSGAVATTTTVPAGASVYFSAPGITTTSGGVLVDLIGYLY